ncbi:lytic transglycosylase domain-containing protein [Pasteurella multocida]|uniref:lytic transglycosylase domain-containing protein n=1 Tax=Pasteurella multocida TaxID=747 RepID=UPI0021587D90|nr:lytic transglycosylase domain-containing protein [Pasteurella multocida]
MIGAEILFACSSLVSVETLNALVQTESSYNPYAIAVVNGAQVKQPKTREEAEKAIDFLESQGANYSVGLGQINKSNFNKYGTSGKELLDSCHNIKISEKILAQCYKDSPNKSVAEALSCYYAGNFSYGFVKEKIGKNRTAYIERIINNFKLDKNVVVPSLKEEIPQALSRVREVRKSNNLKKESGTVKLIKNIPLVNTKTIDENQSSSTTFKF